MTMIAGVDVGGAVMINVMARFDRARLGLSAIIALQVICALVFIWELLASIGDGLVPAIPWAAYELVQIAAAFGLIIGIVSAAMFMRNMAVQVDDAQARVDHAESRLRAASAAFFDMMEDKFSEWALTPAERDVARFAVKGMTTAEIATLRNTSEGTVKAQSAAIYRKAGVSGRPQLISLFIEELLDVEAEATSTVTHAAE